MNKMDGSVHNVNSSTSPRKTYQTPQLVVFGELGRLTQNVETGPGHNDSNPNHFSTN